MDDTASTADATIIDATVIMAVVSPCTGVCTILAGGDICAGCGRTMAEIAAWRGMDEDSRRTVTLRLARDARGR